MGEQVQLRKLLQSCIRGWQKRPRLSSHPSHFWSQVQIHSFSADDGDGDGLTAADRLKYTEAFNIFDKHQQGYIPWKPDFANLWRAIGQNPTEADLKRIIEENDTGTGHFQLETFLKLCENREDALRKEQLIEAFKTFDKDGKGTLTIAQIRYVLMTMGDPLNDEEADRFIDFADKNKEGPTAEIDYEELVERLDDIDPGDKV